MQKNRALTSRELEDKADKLVFLRLGLHENDLVAMAHCRWGAFHKPRAVDVRAVGARVCDHNSIPRQTNGTMR